MAEASVENAEFVQVNAPQTNVEHMDCSQTTVIHYNIVGDRTSKEYLLNCEKEFARKVKDACKNRTGQNIVSDFSSADLVEPAFESFPGLLHVDFYRGVINASEDVQYAPESNFSNVAEKWNGQKIDFENLHAPLGKDKCRCTSLVGGAGTGKSTLLKRYARKVLDEKISLGAPKRRLSIRRRQNNTLVHFINVRELPEGGTFTPRDLLFKDMVKELSEDELEAGYERLKNHHSQCLFVIDGLDQYHWELEKENAKIGYFDEATIGCIMFNLLCGELFPNAWVLTSSRPHKIRFFEKELRADKIISLTGFEKCDIKRLAEELPKSDKTVWQRLNERCPNLLIMCRTPLFLVFTVLVFVAWKDFSLDTMAAVMTALIHNFGNSPHSTTEYPDIFKKLKRLAYEGTLKMKVIFTEEDFRSVSLSSTHANDLFICVPKKTHIIIRQKMFEGDYVMFFCHQSVQETFCSFYVCELPVDEFEEFINDKINTPHFSVVRRLICGLLLNEETLAVAGRLISASNIARKKEILLCALKAEIEKDQRRRSTREFMDLLYSLYEAGTGADILFHSFPQTISACREVLTVADAYVLAKSLSKLVSVELLELWDTNMNRENMEVLWKEIQNSQVKVKKIDIHSNYAYDFDCGILGNILLHCYVEELDINDCDLTDKKLEKFRSFRSEKLKKLAFSKNRRIGPTGFAIIGNIVRESREFHELKIDNCNLTKPKIQSLRKSLCRATINVLDINYSREMGTSGAAIMGMLVCDCKATQVDMSRCNQTPSEMKSFAKGLGEAQLKILNITTHELRKNVTEEYLPAIKKLLPHVIDQIIMLDWEVPGDNLAALQRSIDSTCHAGFTLKYSALPGKTLQKSENS